jgi:iron(III) transport system permease protein
MSPRSSSRIMVVGSATVLFVVCCLLPLGYLLFMSVSGANAAYAAVWLDARQRGLLWNTALLGTGTALLATAIGAPLGLALARIALPRKALMRVALAAPVLLPPYIVALAWTYLGSSRGLVATVAGHDLLVEWTYSLPAAVVVLSLVFYPLSMLATEVALRRVDGRLEEAALVVAPAGRVLWRITLPLVAPSVLAATLIIFVLAVSEFGVPGLLRVRVYTTEVFTAFAALYDFSRAILVAVPLLVLCVLVAALAAAILGERLVSTRRGSGTPPALLDAWQRPAAVAAIVVVTVALGVPLVVLVREAMGAQSWSAVIGGSGDAIANSLLLATAGATAVVGLAVWLGYARARARGRIGQLADVLLLVVFAVPSTIVGVGLIGLWNRPGLLGTVYGTDAMFLLAYLARFVPVAALALAASTRYVPVSHEEAAAVAGAGWLRTVSRIVLPQIGLGVVAAWVIAFILSFGELGVSILVAPPGEATLPIRIYTIIANTPSSHVAVLALLQATVIFIPLAVLGAVASVRPSTPAQGVQSAVEGQEAR